MGLGTRRSHPHRSLPTRSDCPLRLSTGGSIYWLELRPRDRARQVVVERRPDGTTRDLFDAPFSARSRVHEYGGASYLVDQGVCWFTNAEDQRVYRVVEGGAPLPITPEPESAGALRYADFELSPDRRALFAVREQPSGNREVRNELVVRSARLPG